MEIDFRRKLMRYVRKTVAFYRSFQDMIGYRTDKLIFTRLTSISSLRSSNLLSGNAL